MSEARTRGRPRTFDRTDLLDGALDLFWRHGYEGVSITDLTQSLGCTAPTLYSLFGSKEGLYRESLDRYLSRGLGARPELLEGAGTFYSRLETILRVTADSVTGVGHPTGCLILTGGLAVGAAASESAEAIRAIRAVALATVVHHLTAARDARELPAEADVEGLARFYLAVLQGLSAQAVDGATREDLAKVIDVALGAWPGTKG